MKNSTNQHLYFAYGSNLDHVQMAFRCPGATPVGAAHIEGWRFRIYERGYATITQSPKHVVWGGLWNVSDENLEALDRYEGVASGLYLRTTLPVTTADGLVEAIVYVAEHNRDDVPSSSYAERVVAGAEWFELPSNYVAEITEVMA